MENLKEALINPNYPPWDEYLRSLITIPPPSWLPNHYFVRLQEWLLRFEVHKGNQSNRAFKKLNKWESNNKLSREGKKLLKALQALEQLGKLHIKQEKTNTDDPYVLMHAAILEMVNIEMTKLEISQLCMLENAQKLRREMTTTIKSNNPEIKISLEEKGNELKILRQHMHNEIENRSERFSKIVKDDPELRQVYLFFLENEKKIHFRKHFQKADKTSSTLSVFSAFNHLAGSIASFIPGLIQFLLEVGTVLQAIPFINAITSAIPIVINAAKVWMQNKSTTKKSLSILTLGILVGGFITMGFATLAAGVVAVGLMLTGTIAHHVYPWTKMLLDIRDKKKELSTLEKNTEPTSKSSPLTKQEQQFLMMEVEKSWIKNDFDEAHLNSLKELIMDNHVTAEKLETSGFFNDVTDFLQAAKLKRKEHLEKEIPLLIRHEQNKRVRVINGTIAIVGAILLCIPTPVTMVIGASLLMISAVIGIATTFQLATKLTNFMSKLFNASSEPTITAPTSRLKPQSLPQPKNSNGIINRGLRISANISINSPLISEQRNPDLSVLKRIELVKYKNDHPLTSQERKEEHEEEGEGKSKETSHPRL